MQKQTSEPSRKHWIARQGDVLIERVDSIPATAKKAKGKIILAHGEATGHHHSIDEKDPADWWKQGEEQYVHARGTSTVTHQEHASIVLPRGKYKVTRQVEYTPEAIVNVQD